MKILAVAGGRSVQQRLRELGVVSGRELTIIQRQGGGPMVVALGDSRVALGFGVAHKVLVTPL